MVLSSLRPTERMLLKINCFPVQSATKFITLPLHHLRAVDREEEFLLKESIRAAGLLTQ